MSDPPLPSLQLIATLASPSGPTVRAWQSAPYPSQGGRGRGRGHGSPPILATASSDKAVHIWSLRDFTLLSSIRDGHKRSVRCVGWKPDTAAATTTNKKRKLVLASGSFDSNVGIWEYNPASSISNPALSLPLSLPESSGSGIPATDDNEDKDNNESHEQDMTTMNGDDGDNENDNSDEEWIFTTLLTGPDSEIKSLAFAPAHYSATFLATSSRDKSVWIWEEVDADDSEWETVAVLQDHTGDVKCVAWCEGAKLPLLRRRQQQQQQQQQNGEDTSMGQNGGNKEEQETRIIGSREVLASGSYDDTIRLYRDVESEGDWVCIAVLEDHKGTVWSIKFEPYINTALLPPDISTDQLMREWEPRLISCSDDLTVRVWRRELSSDELEKRNNDAQTTNDGSSSGNGSRLPSIIRPDSVYEKWRQEAVLPAVHVRSVYSVDWSSRTGLVVSCGGDGVIALYKEVKSTQIGSSGGGDVDMTGTASASDTTSTATTTWRIVALIEGAHDEYEVNHVCFAPRRDMRREDSNGDGGGDSNGNDNNDEEEEEEEEEEVIISTGDNGDVRIWAIPRGLAAA